MSADQQIIRPQHNSISYAHQIVQAQKNFKRDASQGEPHRLDAVKDSMPEVASSILCLCQSKCTLSHCLAHALLCVHDLFEDLPEPADVCRSKTSEGYGRIRDCLMSSCWTLQSPDCQGICLLLQECMPLHGSNQASLHDCQDCDGRYHHISVLRHGCKVGLLPTSSFQGPQTPANYTEISNARPPAVLFEY